MINKITNLVHIVVLLIYSLIMLVVNKIKGVIKINKHNQEEVEEEENIESFQNNNSTINNNSSIESKLNEPLYKPNDFWASNINEYNDYSIEKTTFDNITLPKNYALQTEIYEKENTPYDYIDFNSTDGSGVHLQGNWNVIGVARPWFESYDSETPSPTPFETTTTTPFEMTTTTPFETTTTTPFETTTTPFETTTTTTPMTTTTTPFEMTTTTTPMTTPSIPSVCNNNYVILPNVDISGNEGVNYEGKNDFNICCNAATQESHDGFYKYRHNYNTGACYYKKIKNELEFYFKIKDVEPIKENEIDNYYGVFFLKKEKYESLKNINYDEIEIEIDLAKNNENTKIIPYKDYSNAVFIDTTSLIDIKYLKDYFEIKIENNAETNKTTVKLISLNTYDYEYLNEKKYTIALQY